MGSLLVKSTRGRTSIVGTRFWTYIIGRSISLLGDGFGVIAMGWLVYEVTGSKLAMGSLYLMNLVPEVVVRLVGAPLIDRLNRIRLMAVLDLVMLSAYSLPLGLALAGHLELWHIYALKLVAGAAAALYRPAAQAVVPALVEDKHLLRANALMSSLLESMRVVGPLLAGILIGVFGTKTALAIDAASFGLSGLTLLLIPAAYGRVQRRAGAPSNYIAEMTEGFRFFAKVPALLVLTLMLGGTYVSAWAIFSMHAPFVREQLGAGAQVVGAMQACWPLGFAVGSAAVGYWGEVKNRRTLMLLSLIGVGAAFVGLAFVQPGQVWLALACKVLEGGAFAMFTSTSTVIFQRLVPDEIRGRVMSARMLLAWGGGPLGAFLGAALGERFGLAPMFLAAGVLPIALGLLGFMFSGLRQVDGDLQIAA